MSNFAESFSIVINWALNKGLMSVSIMSLRSSSISCSKRSFWSKDVTVLVYWSSSMTFDFTSTFDGKTVSKSRIASLVRRFFDCRGGWGPAGKVYVAGLELAGSVSGRAGLGLAESVSGEGSRGGGGIGLDGSVKGGGGIDCCSAGQCVPCKKGYLRKSVCWRLLQKGACHAKEYLWKSVCWRLLHKSACLMKAIVEEW